MSQPYGGRKPNRVVTAIDLDTAWHEAEELSSAFEELTDEELIESRDTLQGRAKHIMTILHDSNVEGV